MAICISCGQETENCLCSNCRQIVDLEKLCENIASYTPGFGKNKLWDRMSAEMLSAYSFRNIIFAVSDELPTPRKEYRRILCMAGNSSSVMKYSRPWLYDTYEVCLENEGLSILEINTVKALVMDALYKDYQFTEAEELATEIMKSDELPKQVYITLGDFYTKTRRYEEADEILSEGKKLFVGDENTLQEIQKLIDDNAKQKVKSETGKQEYLPNPKDNKQEIRELYVSFLATLGIEADVPVMISHKKAPIPIPKDQYPNPVETRETNFDTFVAFDLETTGRSSMIDSIIEFGAIKVVNGQVVDSKEFIFQEFVKPYQRRLSDEIQQLTGISQEDVKDAREMWEVILDFMKFVGDNVLVGFNCITFDSRFMVRAGRYSNLIIENQYFDVMKYAVKFKDKLGIEGSKVSLSELCEKLNAENPRAHRALADAVTTANIYLKLKEMDAGSGNVSVDDMLVDMEDW